MDYKCTANRCLATCCAGNTVNTGNSSNIAICQGQAISCAQLYSATGSSWCNAWQLLHQPIHRQIESSIMKERKREREYGERNSHACCMPNTFHGACQCRTDKLRGPCAKLLLVIALKYMHKIKKLKNNYILHFLYFMWA